MSNETENGLTVEEIKKMTFFDGFAVDADGQHICTNYIRDFLFAEIKLYKGLLEVEQEDCQQVRKNKELNWHRAIVAEAKLATIERDTAATCAAIATEHAEQAQGLDDFDRGYNGSARHVRGSIANHFKL